MLVLDVGAIALTALNPSALGLSSWEVAFALVVRAVSFTISASAGLGGSLLLVPSLSLVLGTMEGVALAALLLGANNVAKVAAYRAGYTVRLALRI